MAKNANGRSTIYKGKDGYWHGRVTVGVKLDGSPDRRHTMSKSKAKVTEKVSELERLRDQGNIPKIGQKWTFGSWLEHWLENIAKPSIRVRTYEAYQNAVNKHLIPGLGKHRLERLEPEHLEAFYRQMIKDGSSPGNAHQVHRTARTALGVAHRRGHITRNAAALAKAPRVPEDEVEPFTIAEAQAILDEARTRRNSARWAIALALGLRQGEVLGIKWDHVDLDTSTIRIRRQRQRPRYAHGCTDTCGKKPGHCPQRIQTNEEDAETKSAAGRRVIGLPDELVSMLKLHRAEQDREREEAANLWQEGGWVFTDVLGRPINPQTDYHAWKALLKRAGVRTARLHDARHTAATVLLALGVPERTTMSIMGWSSTAMAARYQHVTDPIRQDVAKRVGGVLWTPESDAPRSASEAG